MEKLVIRTDNVRESKGETGEHKDTYRAPRLVTLGTAVGLVQGVINGNLLDYDRRRPV
jgi:hypothetical protein